MTYNVFGGTLNLAQSQSVPPGYVYDRAFCVTCDRSSGVEHLDTVRAVL